MTYNDLLSNINKNTNEEMFQKAWDNNDWDTIWLCTFRCCNNITKSIYKRRGVIIPDEDLLAIVTDATAYCIKFFKKGVRPNKLSSYTFLRCRRYIDDPKDRQWNEKISEISVEDYLNYKDKLEIGEE